MKMITNSTAPRCNRVTMKGAKAELKALGMTIARAPCDDGEYRVTFTDMKAEEAERSAYYTTDLDDAVATAKQMMQRRVVEASRRQLAGVRR